MRLWTHAPVIAATLALSAAAAHAQTVADLSVVKTGPDQSDADTDVAFEVTLTNNGPDAADTVVLSDPSPLGTTFVSATQNAGPPFICSDPGAGGTGLVSCTAATLDSGASASFTFVFHIDASTAPGTFITNVATSSTATDPNDENNSGVATTQTPPPPAADMRVSKSGPAGTNPDTDVVYTIEVGNGGPGQATNVTFTDTLPGTMTFVSLSGGGPMSCTTPAVGSGGTITCTAATFAAGVTATLTLVVHVPADTEEGTTFQNFATVTSGFDSNAENDSGVTLVCVQGDSCAAGPCTGISPVVCSAGQCQQPGTCDPVSGTCSPSTPVADGTACDDGSACTQSDTCQSGLCAGNDPVVCTPAGQCRTQGTCDPATGVCAPNPPRPDGLPCTDGNLCTQPDTCQSGVCTGDPVVCPLAGPCEIQGTCRFADGTCAPNLPREDGVSCDDGDMCTQVDVCQSGVCAGGDAVICPVAEQCQVQGTCDGASGTCAPNAPVDDGTACTDTNACTQNDTCQAGTCQGGAALGCDDADPCTVDTCDPALGCIHAGSCGDGGVADAAVDGPIADAGLDAAAPPRDAASTPPDAATADAVTADAATRDARGADAAAVTESGDGCGCRAAGGNGRSPALAWLALLALVFACKLRPRPRR